MTERNVFSGETEMIDSMRAKWYADLNDDRLEWEDLAASRSINDFLGRLKVVPLYRYLVNYLIFVYFEADFEHVPAEKALDLLVKKVQGEYRKNGMPAELCTPRHIREMLTTEWSREWDNFENASTQRIFELALGLNLSEEDVEKFLKKAIKRPGFNYYDSEELLMYCVLRYQKNDRCRCYQALKRDYGKLKASAGHGVNAGSVSKPGGTEKVRDRLELIMEGPIYRNDCFETEYLNRRLADFLAEQKSSVITCRTAALVFEELFHKFVEEHRKEILDFKNLYHGSEEFAETMLQVTYDASKTRKLPKNTVFYAESPRKKEKDQIIRFVNTEDIFLPACENRTVTIPIQSCEQYRIEKEKKQTPGYIGKKEELILENPTEIRLTNIKTATTIKFVGKPGESAYASGELTAEAPVGTQIPEGTLFRFGEYLYRSTKEVNTQASISVKVRCTSPYREKTEITGTDTIHFMEKPIAGILSITNPKPVKMKVPTDTISTELFREFLYMDLAEELEGPEQQIDKNLLGRWFTETEITSARFTKIRKQIEGDDRITRKEMQKNEVKRSDIITLAFLCFCMDDSMSVSWKMEADAEMIYQDFLLEVNELLEKCGMMPFYLENPYECLLAYLIQTDSPVDSLRNLWKIVHSGRRDT